MRRTLSSARRRTSSGSAVVETALVFLAFAFMVIAALDFGQFLFVHQALVERARYAARWGSINSPGNTDAIRNMVLYNQSSQPTSGTATYFNLVDSNVSVTADDIDTDDYRINVYISGYTYKILSPTINGTYTGIPITVSVPLGLYR